MEITKDSMFEEYRIYQQLDKKKKASEIRGFFRLCNHYLSLRNKGKTLPANVNKIIDWYIKNTIS